MVNEDFMIIMYAQKCTLELVVVSISCVWCKFHNIYVKKQNVKKRYVFDEKQQKHAKTGKNKEKNIKL